MHIAKRLVVVVGLVQLIAVASASAAGNAPARPDTLTAQAVAAGPISIIEVTNDPGTQQHSITASVSLTGTTDDDGGGNDVVCAVVFDDGDVVASQCANIPVGSTVDTVFTLQWVGPLGRIAPGVGLYILDSTSASFDEFNDPRLAVIDPLFVIPIPTLSQWAQILMIGFLAAVGLWTLRRGFSGPRGIRSLS